MLLLLKGHLCTHTYISNFHIEDATSKYIIYFNFMVDLMFSEKFSLDFISMMINESLFSR